MSATELIAQLKEYRSLRREVDHLNAMLADRRISVGIPAVPVTGMPRGKGSTGDPTGRQAQDLADTALLLRRMVACEREQLNALLIQVQMIDDPQIRTILRARYICDGSWLRVGMAIGADEKTAKRRLAAWVQRVDGLPELPSGIL